jgi:hypothetical protein
MSQQIIDLGTGPDSQTGDDLYTAFTKVNDNFTELYSVFDGNGITEINANVIVSNNIWNSGNVRTNEVFAYGNVETVGYVITAGAFYPNGIPIGSLSSVTTNIIPLTTGVYNLGSENYTFSNLYLSNSVVISGANISVDSGSLLVNGLSVGNYSNTNVASYLPIYDGNTAAVLTTTSQPYVTQLGTLTNLDALTANINGNLLVSGNLSVEGNITYFNIRDLSVVDPIISLNTGPNGSPLIANNGFDSGVKTFYYDTQNKEAFFGRIDSTGYFEYYSNVISEIGNIVSGTYGTIKTGNLILTENADITGNITANYFIGNGRNITDINAIYDGNSNVVVQNSGPVTVSAEGTSNVAVFTANGANVAGDFYVTGTISATQYIGNVSGNITAPGNNTEIIFNDNGLLSASSGLTFISSDNSLVVVGNLQTSANIVVNGYTVVDDTGNVVTSRLENSGVIVGTYGNASAVPIVTVDEKGRITDINTTPVAGVSNVTYEITDSNLSIFTSAGTVFSVNLGVGINNSPVFAGTTITGNLFAESANANTIITDGTAYLYNISSTGLSTLTTLDVLGNANVVANVDANNLNVTNQINATEFNVSNISAINATYSGNVDITGNLNSNIIGQTATFSGNVNAETFYGNIDGVSATFTSNIVSNNIISNSTVITNDLAVSNYVTTNLIPSITTTYDLGSSDNRWRDLYLSGSTIYLGNIEISESNDSFTTANIDITNFANIGSLEVQGNTSITGLLSGTIADFTGNITAGNISVENVVSTNLIVTDVSATTGTFTGNVTTGNVSGINLTSITVSATTGSFSGNVTTGNISGTNLTGTNLSVTSVSATTGSFSGNVTTGNISGTNLTGTAVSTTTGTFSGNVTTGNLITTGVYASTIGNTGSLITGTLTTASQPNITSVGSTLTIGEFSFLNNTISSTSDTITIEPANVGSTGNVIIEGNLRVTGNVTYIDSEVVSINDKDILLANNTSNISDLNGAGILIGNANGINLVTLKYSTTLDSWQTNVGFSPTGNVNLDLGTNSTYWANLFVDNINSTTINGTLQTSAQTNITSLGVLTGLSVNGEITATNITANSLSINNSADIGSTLDVTGNVTAPYFIGNIIGNISGNVSSPGNNTEILFNDNGLIAGDPGITYNKTTNELTVVGNVVAGNISAAKITGTEVSASTGTFSGNVTTGNVSGTNLSGTNLAVTDVSATTGVFSGNVTTGNVSGTNLTGTNLSATSVSATTGTFSGNVSGTNLSGTNLIVTDVSAATGSFSGNVSTGNVSGTNITGTNLIVTDVSATTGAFSGNVTTGNVSGTNLSGTNLSVTSVSATTGAFSGNVTTGNVNGTNLSGTNLAVTDVSATTGSFSGNVTTGNLVTTGVYASTIGNTGSLITGTLITAAQPNITTVGSTLTVGEFSFLNNTIFSTSDTITIEPANVGSTGNVIIEGNLRVTGNLTYIDSTVVTLNDKDILLANNTSNISDLNGAGILIGNANGINLVTLKYSTTLDSWQTNIGFSPTGNVNLDLGTNSTYWANSYIETVNSSNLVGILQTSAQPNVTSLGTLTGLIISGNLIGTSIQANSISLTDNLIANTLSINSSASIGTTLTVTGNVTAPYFIGNIIGNITGNITSPGNNTEVLFNDNGLISGDTGITFNKSSDQLTVLGNIIAGNVSGTNLTGTAVSATTGSFSGNVTTGNVSGTNLTSTNFIGTNTIVATVSAVTGIFSGNVTAGNISATGVIGNTGTFSGNVSSNNLVVTNQVQASSISVTANASFGNISTTGLITTTNSSDSISNITGAVTITGGLGVGKNMYVGNAVGWVYANSVSAVYQVFNPITNSLDTIFGG